VGTELYITIQSDAVLGTGMQNSC